MYVLFSKIDCCYIGICCIICIHGLVCDIYNLTLYDILHVYIYVYVFNVLYKINHLIRLIIYKYITYVY